MDNWLNYHHLYYFRTIATEGSIARAAEKLRLGQPTLSAQLKQLEDKIGVRLFDRQHKKLILTESGRIALEYSSEIFRMGSELLEVLHDRLTPSRVHVQLGALDSVPKHLIYRLVDAAYQTGPCQVTILEGGDDELLRLLLGHKIDLMLTNHLPSVADGKKIFVKSLGKLPVVVCGSPKFKGLKKGFPKSMDRAPFVMPTQHSRLRHEIEHFFKTVGIAADVVGETQDTSLQKIMGAKGVGLIPISEFAAKSLVGRGELINLGTLEGVHEEIFLVSASRKIENPIAGALLKRFTL